MVQANTLDISEYQDPSNFPYKEAKQAGIERLIIRESHGTTEDKYVKQHIANAKEYGLEWHLYHFWENEENESTYALQHAKDLGLTSDQYFFLDMEGDLPANWDDQFTGFLNTVKSSFHVGLYCSESPYEAKFNDSQLQQLNVLRWIANYSKEPANYDMWQMSGAGSGGFGSYTADIDRNYAKPNVFATSKPSEPDQPKPTPTPMTDEYRAIVLDKGYDVKTGVFGRVCSPDNGNTTKIYFTPYGIVWHADDVATLWDNFLKDKVEAVKSGNVSVSWNDITDKPDVATQDDLKKIELTPGPQGQPGTQGKDGQPGKDGKSAYQIAVDNGFVGSEAEWLDSLHGKDGASSSGGDASLSIEAITDLIKQHIHALVDANNGQLTISTDDISNGSIADAVAAKVVSSMSWKLSTDGELIAEVGGE